jgi:hypothetical protein
MMTELWGLLFVAALALAFWQRRKQAEHAKQLVAQKCKQLELQLLSVNYSGVRLSRQGLQWRYQFEFASVADSRYIGELQMQGRHYQFDIPAYKETFD